MDGQAEMKRFTMRDAARLLGCSYGTVRKYVVEKAVVPCIRRGDGSANGSMVLIDEDGLASLRKLLPPIPAGTPAG